MCRKQCKGAEVRSVNYVDRYPFASTEYGDMATCGSGLAEGY